MQSEMDLKPGARPIVYVRPVAVSELPEEVQHEAEGIDTIFAVHNAEGERLALVREEKIAFLLANQNNMSAVHVH